MWLSGSIGGEELTLVRLGDVEQVLEMQPRIILDCFLPMLHLPCLEASNYSQSPYHDQR